MLNHEAIVAYPWRKENRENLVISISTFRSHALQPATILGLLPRSHPAGKLAFSARRGKRCNGAAATGVYAVHAQSEQRIADGRRLDQTGVACAGAYL